MYAAGSSAHAVGVGSDQKQRERERETERESKKNEARVLPPRLGLFRISNQQDLLVLMSTGYSQL